MSEEMKAIENLIEYVKEDDIYNGTRENLSDFDEFCINHCTDIEIVLEKIQNQQSELEFQKEINKTEKNRHKQTEKSLKGQLEKKDKIINEMAEYLSVIRDCPNADKGANIDCENSCKDNFKECWKQYFKRKIIPEEK